MNVFPEIMNKILDFSKNSTYEIRCGNCLARSNTTLHSLGSSSLEMLPQKFGIKHVTKSKK